jgi:N-methylhydantoinase A/acetone carboxylase, beta subunit
MLVSRLDKMTVEVRAELMRQGFEEDRIHVQRMLNMRFEGTDTAMMIIPDVTDGDGDEDFESAFKKAYRIEFGFLLEGKTIIIDDIKVIFILIFDDGMVLWTRSQVRGIGKTFDTLGESVYAEISRLTKRSVDRHTAADSTYSVYFDRIGRVDDTPVFLLDKLGVGDVVEGPAMIIDDTQTIVVVPGAKAVLTSKHLYITLEWVQTGPVVMRYVVQWFNID